MKQLILIRHAKSDWSTASLGDLDRPLNERGKKDAPQMAKRLLAKKIKIDAFVSNVKGLFARIQTLDDWRKIVVAENFRALGYSGDVLLSDYLKDVKAKLNKGKAFDSLVKFLRQKARETGKA